MYFMPQELVLVCAGADCARARDSGRAILHFGLAVGRDGGVFRTVLSQYRAGCYLGVSDRGMERFHRSSCEQLLAEAARVNAAGLLIDCERDHPAVHEFVKAMDHACTQRELPLFVPLCQAAIVEQATLVVDSALSGGSLSERFGQLVEQYPGRIAADLRRISRDFLLPAPDSEGQPITDDVREALRKRVGAQTFFSRELCARYFTYMDGQGNGHFVLFDDDNTLREKCRCLDTLGVHLIFARYAEAKTLL